MEKIKEISYRIDRRLDFGFFTLLSMSNELINKLNIYWEPIRLLSAEVIDNCLDAHLNKLTNDNDYPTYPE